VVLTNGNPSAPEDTQYSSVPFCFCNDKGDDKGSPASSGTQKPTTGNKGDTASPAPAVTQKPPTGSQGTVGPPSRAKYSGFRYPKGCADKDCIYMADIKVDSTSDTVTSVLRARIEKTRWFGLGFTEQKGLKNIDLGVCMYEGDNDKTPRCLDTYWKNGPGSKITVDSQQDLTNCQMAYNDATGDMSCNFTRKRDTGDDEGDVSLSF